VLGGVFLRYNAQALTQEEAFAAAGYMLGMLGPINALGSFNSRVIWSAGSIINVYKLTVGVVPSDSKLNNPRSAPSARARVGIAKDSEISGKGGASENDNDNDNGGDGTAPGVLIENLVFQYPAATAPTLKGLSAEVRCGEFVALCGASGSGKSTLLKLLGRANHPDIADANAEAGADTDAGVDADADADTDADADAATRISGSVTVDGVAADDYMQTAFCTQSVDVLDGSLRDNITFGCAYDSDDDVRRAVRRAGLAPVIQALPQGYDTVIGRGSSVSLSGGQLARLGIARALCCRPRLILLDEVTSGLEPEAQEQILATLRALTREMPVTLILSTHSVQAAEATDRIILLDQGVIAETGTFAELVARRGPFYAIARSHLHAPSSGSAGAPEFAVPVPSDDAAA
jgi:ABC-type multidrug transport system fused ATPase/permease subunit